jgi:hypothetical protein
MPRIFETTTMLERFLLVTYRLEPAVAVALLPGKLKPQIRHGFSGVSALVPFPALPEEPTAGGELAQPHRALFLAEAEEKTPILLWQYSSSQLLHRLSRGDQIQHAHFQADTIAVGAQTRLRLQIEGDRGTLAAEVLSPAPWVGSKLFSTEGEAHAFALSTRTLLGAHAGKVELSVEACRVEHVEASMFEDLESATLDSVYLLQHARTVRRGAHEVSIERLRQSVGSLAVAPLQSVSEKTSQE